MIAKITKMVPRSYYVIDGVELNANDVFCVLENVTCGDGDDIEYYLDSCADKLVELGYLNKRYGMRQCVIYEDTEDKKAAALFKEILSM
jgi:hypothetical protein